MGKELPKGWVIAKLDDLFYLVYGKGLRVKEMTEEGYDVYGANGIIGKYSECTYEKSKVIISCRGAASGAIHKTNEKSFITSNSIILDEYSDKLIDSGFVMYNMRNIDKTNVITGTAQPQITIQLLKDLPFPLAPLPEQKRIVTKLDTLFGHLDQLKARLESIPLLLKNFRQSVLTQAVTGKLTDSKVNWKEEILSNLTTKVGSGATPKGGQASYKKDGIPLVRSMNIHFNGIKYDGIAYIDEFQADALKNVEIKPDDVLLNITGASIGRVCVAEDKVIGGRVNQHVSILRTNDDILSQYLNLYLASPIMQDSIFEQNYGVTRQALTKTQILNFKIPLPSIEEQKQIVKRVESLFAKADGIEEKYKNLKEKIDQLPQAILAKAFKGELVELLPTDGDARELLEEIRKLKKE